MATTGVLRTAFDATVLDYSDSLMIIEGVGSVELHMPPMVKGKNVNELPPCSPRRVYLVDDYERCPQPWFRSNTTDGVPWKSYFIPVQAKRGMWLNFNQSYAMHKYHVAVVVSIQGVCALTGRRQKGESLQLEQYIEKCPTHDIPFGEGRYCPKCKYKWLRQNYLCGPQHIGSGSFWLDGFRNANGEVRQWYFTEDDVKGIARNVLGSDRCFAVGIAFYLSVEPRSEEHAPQLYPYPIYVYPSPPVTSPWQPQFPYIEPLVPYVDVWQPNSAGTLTQTTWSNSVSDTIAFNSVGGGGGDICLASLQTKGQTGKTGPLGAAGVMCSMGGVKPKQLEIGAGTRIRQITHDDPEDLSFWRSKPSGIIVATYCDEETTNEILAGGKLDRTNNGEGWLGDLPYVKE